MSTYNRYKAHNPGNTKEKQVFGCSPHAESHSDLLVCLHGFAGKRDLVMHSGQRQDYEQ